MSFPALISVSLRQRCDEDSRTARYYYLKILRIRGNPHAIALGAAIGIFVGMTPTVPLHTVIIFVLCLLARASFLSGLITSWLVGNPLTSLPLYFLALTIGNLVTPYQVDWAQIKSVTDTIFSESSVSLILATLGELGLETLIVMLAGGFLLALPFGLASYYLFYQLILRYQRQRYSKHLLH
jgi:uncharacterized protein